MAWLNMLCADCVRIWFRVNCMVSDAKSVSRIRLSASVRLVTMSPKFETVVVSRFMVEPMVERIESTEVRMLSMLLIAVVAEVCNDTPPKVRPVERFAVALNPADVALKLIVELLPVEAALIWKEKLEVVESSAMPL